MTLLGRVTVERGRQLEKRVGPKWWGFIPSDCLSIIVFSLFLPFTTNCCMYVVHIGQQRPKLNGFILFRGVLLCSAVEAGDI